MATLVAAGVAAMPASSRAADDTASLLATANGCRDSDSATAGTDLQVTAMHCMLDFARKASGLPALAREPLLQISSGIKADDIVRCDVLSHTACGRDVDAPFADAGYLHATPAPTVSENLGVGFGSAEGTPHSIMEAWLEEPEHRATILDGTWRDQGVALREPAGVALGFTQTAIWVAHFGSGRPGVAPTTGSAPEPRPGRSAISQFKISPTPGRASRGMMTRYRFTVKSLHGRVWQPVRRVVVYFAGRRARTNAVGRATIWARLVRAGNYRVLVRIGSKRATATVVVARR